MSDLHQVPQADIDDLVESVERLSLVVVRLAGSRQAPAVQSGEHSRSSVVGEEEWEVVEPGHVVDGLTEPVVAGHRFRIAEDGPGPVPRSLEVIARQRLSVRGGGPVARARRAWSAGFWARVSVDTCTPYSRAEGIDLQTAHWICLRGSSFSTPKRTTRKVDLVSLLSGPEEEQIWEEFPSFTELSIFCAAASIDVPDLVRWNGTN